MREKGLTRKRQSRYFWYLFSNIIPSSQDKTSVCLMPGPALQANHCCLECCVYREFMLVMVNLNWVQEKRGQIRGSMWANHCITNVSYINVKVTLHSVEVKKKKKGRKGTGSMFVLIKEPFTDHSIGDLSTLKFTRSSSFVIHNVLPWYLIHCSNFMKSCVHWLFIYGVPTMWQVLQELLDLGKTIVAT